ncbi:MAG: winged helix-turn-helix transcriptional regulator [Pseudomonadota bacterium]
MLNTRLKELRDVGLIENGKGGYALTATGRDLFERLEPLGDWAMEWVPTL